jgi:predicted nucleotidyltransferase
MSSRFSQTSKQDIDVLLEDRTSKNTKRVTNVAKRLLDAFCLIGTRMV